MDAFEKLKREEARWQFSQQSRFFEHVFSRPILGVLWWWWLFVTYFLVVFLTTPSGEPYRRSFYASAVFVTAFSVWLVVLLFSKERRSRWLAKQAPTKMPFPVGLGIQFVPWLCGLVIAWCLLMR